MILYRTYSLRLANINDKMHLCISSRQTRLVSTKVLLEIFRQFFFRGFTYVKKGLQQKIEKIINYDLYITFNKSNSSSHI